MDLRIYCLIIWILSAKYAETCSYKYEENTCSYTETCTENDDRYEPWETFIINDNNNHRTYLETCISPIEFDGSTLYPVNLILTNATVQNETPIPLAIYSGESEKLDRIYGLDLSNNRFSDTPLLRNMPNLVKLDLSYNYLTMGIFSNINSLPILSEINLSHNAISIIEVFANEPVYEYLKTIDLSYNILKELPDDIFGQFPRLEKLDLSNNDIELLSLTAFENVKNMVNLNLSYNKLKDVGSSLFRFSELKILDLSWNMINDIKKTNFERLTELETLKLSNNNIKHITGDVFNTLASLKKLYLNRNSLELLDRGAFAGLHNLTTVDLSYNNLKSLPTPLFPNSEVTVFLIIANKLEGSLERGMFEGVNVKTLELHDKCLTEIKDYAFHDLIKLRMLILDSNNIHSLSKFSFSTLINLKTLLLSNNQITNIDFDKKDLGNLTELLLGNNRITEINDKSFQYLSKLEYLDISANQIAFIQPKSFMSLEKLSMLHIFNNSIDGILETGTFQGLISVPRLDISRNKLTMIQNATFYNMTRLRELNISRCNISDLQYNSFINTKNINSLDISFNKLYVFIVNTTDLHEVNTLLLNNNLLKSITSCSLFGLSELKHIDLSRNVMENIYDNSFISLINLQYLDLSHNNKLNFTVKVLAKNKYLNKLFLSGVKIQTNFTSILSDNLLSNLELSNTSIKNISELNFGKMSDLYNLDLSFNNISKLNIGDFVGLPTLGLLDLSFNQITFIPPGVFNGNNDLVVLNISHNFLSSIAFGVFRGLIDLTVLDISFNNIKNIQTELFYEAEKLHQLIVDHNKIDSINAEEFIGTQLTALSIGNNPLPCEVIAKIKKNSMITFEITAIRTDEHHMENVHGITCNKHKILGPIVRSKEEISNHNTFNELPNILYELSNRNTEQNHMENQYLEKISNILEKSNTVYNEKFSDLVNLNNNTNMMFNKNNVMLNKIIKLLNQTIGIRLNMSSIPQVGIPMSSTYATLKLKNTHDKTIDEQNMNTTENKLTRDDSIIKTETLGTNRQQLVSNIEGSKYYFTEVCEVLILLILVGFILYKFCKYKTFRRNQFSVSTRELPAAMEHSSL